MSLCDPLLSPSGLKHLKQVIVGPPVGHTEHIRLDQRNEEAYVSSIMEAIAELYFQSPALQLIALLLSANMQATGRGSSVRSNHALRDTWIQLNEDNHADFGTLPSKSPQVCLVLRTRWAHLVSSIESEWKNKLTRCSTPGADMGCLWSSTDR